MYILNILKQYIYDIRFDACRPKEYGSIGAPSTLRPKHHRLVWPSESTDSNHREAWTPAATNQLIHAGPETYHLQWNC